MFTAAGKPYLTTAQLTTRKDGEQDGILYRGYKVPAHRDLYGRRVLCFRERFPCFDEYDRMHENRYYRWYAILHDEGVTLVYTEDEKPGAKVHENYQPKARTGFYMPSWIDGELIYAGFFERPE